MADKEILDLTDGGAAASGDVVHAVRGPNSRMVELGDAAGKDTGTGSENVAAGDHTHANYIPTSYLDTDVALTANSDSKVPTQKAVKAYADSLIAAADAMTLEGVIDCSANPNYPAADAGHVYVVSVAGKIGGGSGPNVEIGDRILCIADSTSSGNHATVGSSWVIGQANIDGAVTLAGSQTLTNKTLDAPVINNPTGLDASDVGLGNVTNVEQLPISYLDTDTTLAANSDTKVASQKAVKAYADAILTTIRNGVSSAFDTLAEIATELGNKVGTTRTITTSTGLTGGGDLSADRTLEVDKASDANVRANASNKVLTADLLSSAAAFVTLTETSGTVAVDWSSFVNGVVTVDQATVISNPTAEVPGQQRYIVVKGNDTTDRAITFGNQFLGDLPTITDCDSTKWYGLLIDCIDTDHFTVQSHVVKKP